MPVTPDTKDGKLIRATHWCDAGTPVRDIRLTCDHIALLAAACGQFADAGADEENADEYAALRYMLLALEPDCLNDTTA
jgi:hypothetical protein